MENRRFSALWLLLLLPYIGLLWVPFYNMKMPELFGFPFFYWYQLAWVPLTSILIYIVYGASAMTNNIDPVALGVFLFFFALVTVMGFVAARWRRPATLAHIDEWGLGGRQFGTWITWFLIGGDFYTAYTVIAVPALVYAVGAYGFFALPYTIIVYPFVFAVMPILWKVAKKNNYVTAGDVVYGRYGSRALEAAVAATGVIATMPYIALQLVGMAAVLKALGFAGTGLAGELPLVIAFIILAVYTYSSGLRAPALIAFVKDIMIYIAVIAAVIVLPIKFGGYGAIFQAAGEELAKKAAAPGGNPTADLILAPSRILPYASLALGSALAAFMYPHTLTGVFASSGARTLRKNAVLLPAYTLLLGLLALLGYMGLAAHLKLSSPNDVVPVLFQTYFPSWFAGFAFAAVAIGALVPAAVMSIGAANLFTRNFWKAYVDPAVTPAGEAQVAKISSLVVKFGALLFIIVLPTQFALDLQLLGGLWILQTFPAVVFGLFTGWFRAPALLLGWAVGFIGGSWLVYADAIVTPAGVKLQPLHTFVFADSKTTIYTGLVALAANVVVAVVANAVIVATAPRGRLTRAA